MAVRREDLDFVDRAPIVIRRSVHVEASPSDVWPALADAPTWTEWFAGMREARWTSDAPHGVGSTRSVHVQSLRADEEVLAFDVDERFAFRVVAASPPLVTAMVEEVTLTPDGVGTTVTYTQALELAPLFRLLAPMLRRRMARGLDAGLAGLSEWVATGR